MNTLNKETRNARRLNPSLPLFWRLFLSLLLLLLITSVISVAIERWINAQALETRMATQVAHLVMRRQDIVPLLELGDTDGIRQLYRSERGLKSQIIIIDEQGNPLLSKFEPLIRHNNKPDERFDNPALPPNQTIQEVVPNTGHYPELSDMSVTSMDGTVYTVRLQPRLPLQELLTLQKTHFFVRFGIILLFSLLACYWFSRTLSRRIRHVQFAVHRMSAGNYLDNQADNLSKWGDDELGALAKDVARLSDRLADSELSRKQMLSDISHELRSPLARLEVATELTRDYAPEATHYLDRIQKESARMNELIGQIIHIQSLQMQRYVARIEECESLDISMLLDEIGQDVCFEFQDKHIEWQYLNSHDKKDAKPDSVLIGNREQLHSAFENIIRNAFLHSAPYSLVSAEIKAIQLADKTPALKIALIDQGAGIDNADLARIFQPFVRLDASRQRPTVMTSHQELNAKQARKREGGYGLGLAIAQAIVDAHKGQISAHNRKDGVSGLVVTVILPMSTLPKRAA